MYSIGELAKQKYGSYFPQATAQICSQADGILFGAVSKGGLLELRKKFDFFVNSAMYSHHLLVVLVALLVLPVEGVDVLLQALDLDFLGVDGLVLLQDARLPQEGAAGRVHLAGFADRNQG